MKKLNMLTAESLTFAEGCTKYLDNCRQRNLREGTINHYKQSYVQFAKFFDMNMPVENITSDMYKKYVVYLRSTLQNDVSINSYLRDLTVLQWYFYLHSLSTTEQSISWRKLISQSNINERGANPAQFFSLLAL